MNRNNGIDLEVQLKKVRATKLQPENAANSLKKRLTQFENQ